MKRLNPAIALLELGFGLSLVALKLLDFVLLGHRAATVCVRVERPRYGIDQSIPHSGVQCLVEEVDLMGRGWCFNV